MIIDSHIHVCRTKYKGSGLHTDALKEMKRSGVDKAVVIANFKNTELNYDTAGTVELLSENGEFILIGSVNMESIKAAYLKYLDKLLKKKTIRGVKLYPGYQHVYPDDKKLDPVFELCQKHNVPLIVHTGDTLDLYKTARVKFSHPLAVDEIAGRYSRLKIIIAHLGNPWTEDCAEVLMKNENVYADISGFFYTFGYKRYNKLVARKINDVIAYTGGAKLLFGTDWPIIGMKEYLKFVKQKIELTKEWQESLFSGNAINLFRIEQ